MTRPKHRKLSKVSISLGATSAFLRGNSKRGSVFEHQLRKHFLGETLDSANLLGLLLPTFLGPDRVNGSLILSFDRGWLESLLAISMDEKDEGLISLNLSMYLGRRLSCVKDTWEEKPIGSASETGQREVRVEDKRKSAFSKQRPCFMD